MKVALIDCDTVVYEATTSSEKAVKWDDDLWTLYGFENEATDKLNDIIADIMAATKADSCILALSSYGARWRNTVMPSYKQNRAATRKPLMYPVVRQYCHDHYETFERPTLEGDDVLGILMTHPTLVKDATEKVCVSIDKDLKTIPGRHYNYKKEAWLDVPEFVADYYHIMQTLTGDTTDGYPGCPGIGPVSALKVLGIKEGDDLSGFTVADAWPKVVAAYAKAKGGALSEEVALMNARVARICRHTDYDFQKKEVKLWNAPK